MERTGRGWRAGPQRESFQLKGEKKLKAAPIGEGNYPSAAAETQLGPALPAARTLWLWLIKKRIRPASAIRGWLGLRGLASPPSAPGLGTLTRQPSPRPGVGEGTGGVGTGFHPPRTHSPFPIASPFCSAGPYPPSILNWGSMGTGRVCSPARGGGGR